MTMLSPTVDQLEAATMRRVSWRLMPFLLAAYIICYIDRVNVGFAALQMNKAVGIDPKTYGLGAGIFFLGYFFFEVPSNLALQRFGARTWIARIMISWVSSRPPARSLPGRCRSSPCASCSASRKPASSRA
jgi:sugar phosphate permease